MFNIENCISLAKLQFKLDINGIHGIEHWIKVMETAQKISKTNKADYEVVTLFGIFHDCCRLTDKEDPEHGIRAAQYIKLLEINLSTEQRNILEIALRNHNLSNMTTTDPTIGACWDADRLDLFRVGITPEYEDMSTLEGIEMMSKIINKPKPDFLSEMTKELKIASESEKIFKPNKTIKRPKKYGKISKHGIFK